MDGRTVRLQIFDIGDMVAVFKDKAIYNYCCGLRDGEVGRVIYISPHPHPRRKDWLYSVEFDHEFPDGHDAGGVGAPRRCRYFRESELTPFGEQEDDWDADPHSIDALF